MLQEIKPEIKLNTTGIDVSEAAAGTVLGILSERNLEGYSLRVYVAGSSCCGAQFGMALDNNVRSNDMTFSANGIQVIVDDVSIEHLRGATIDYINDPVRGAGFVVNNPVEMGGSCACGSGGHAHGEEGGSCGCGGGSCGCGGH